MLRMDLLSYSSCFYTYYISVHIMSKKSYIDILSSVLKLFFPSASLKKMGGVVSNIQAGCKYFKEIMKQVSHHTPGYLKFAHNVCDDVRFYGRTAFGHVDAGLTYFNDNILPDAHGSLTKLKENLVYLRVLLDGLMPLTAFFYTAGNICLNALYFVFRIRGPTFTHGTNEAYTMSLVNCLQEHGNAAVSLADVSKYVNGLANVMALVHEKEFVRPIFSEFLARKHVRAAEACLESPLPIDWTVRDHKGNTALHWVIWDRKWVEALLPKIIKRIKKYERGKVADVVDWMAANDEGMNILSLAAWRGHLSVLWDILMKNKVSEIVDHIGFFTLTGAVDTDDWHRFQHKNHFLLSTDQRLLLTMQ